MSIDEDKRADTPAIQVARNSKSLDLLKALDELFLIAGQFTRRAASNA